MMRSIWTSLVFLLISCTQSDAFAPANPDRLLVASTTPSALLARRRGRSSSAAFGDMASQQRQQPAVNWIPTEVSTKSLPSTDNTVGLIETNLPTLKNAQTNPAGAVAVTKFDKTVYCFDVQCPSCRIPLTKAAVTTNENGEAVLVCDFCKSTYQLEKGGERSEKSAVEPGFLGSVAMKVFSAQKSQPLRMYKLGEKKGKVLISLD